MPGLAEGRPLGSVAAAYPAAAEPRGPPSGLGCRGPGGIQPDQLRDQHLRGPHAGGGSVRRVQPGLRDLRVRAQRVAWPGHRPADGQVQRHRPADLAARRSQVRRDGHERGPGHRRLRACGRRGAERRGQGLLPRPRADAARAAAAGQLAVLVLRARSRQPGLPQRQRLGGDAISRPVPAEQIRARGRVLVRFRLGPHGGDRRRRRAVAGAGRAQAVGCVGVGVTAT